MIKRFRLTVTGDRLVVTLITGSDPHLWEGLGSNRRHRLWLVEHVLSIGFVTVCRTFESYRGRHNTW